MSDLTTIISIGVSGGLAALAIVLNQRSRKDSFVRTVHDRKLRAYDNLMNAVGNWMGVLLGSASGWEEYSVVPEPGERETPNHHFAFVRLSDQHRAQLAEARAMVYAALIAESPFLPSRVPELVRQGIEYVDGLTQSKVAPTGFSSLEEPPKWLQELVDVVKEELHLERAENFVNQLWPRALRTPQPRR